MAKEKYDVFISYRRGSGLYLAKNIATSLQGMGYKVFFDYDSMRNNEFDEQIYTAIENSKDFILVLTEGALDRCALPNDWVANEVLHAKKHKKNIILATDAERFKDCPPNLPASMDFLRKIDWTPIHPKLFEGSLKLLRKRLTSHSSKLRYLIYLFLGILIIALGLLLYIWFPPKTIKYCIDEDEDYPIELPAIFDKDEDVDEYESQFPNEDELIAFRSSLENKKYSLFFYIEDFEEIDADDYGLTDEELESRINILKSFSVREYIKSVKETIKKQHTSFQDGVEPIVFETGRFEWEIINFIDKEEKQLCWRIAAKFSETVYVNINMSTDEMNKLQIMRFTYNIKRFLEKNDKVIKKFLTDEYE